MQQTQTDAVDRAAGWSVGLGIVMVILGALAILWPVAGAAATNAFVAWIIFLGGFIKTVHAFRTRAVKGFGWRLITGLLYLLLGIWMLLYPLEGIAALTLWIAALLFASGIVVIVLAFNLRPRPGWSWVLVDGIIAVVLAVLLTSGWPANSILFISAFVGINLIWSGVWRIYLSTGARKLAHHAPPG
jgi:uncharacterized membrane protein HdeD (DUF308 family)